MKIGMLSPLEGGNFCVAADLRGMYRLLNRKHECFVYCRGMRNGNFPAIGKSEIEELAADENSLLIYQKSGSWGEADSIVAGAKARAVIKCYSSGSEASCDGIGGYDAGPAGQIRELAGTCRNALWMFDSGLYSKNVALGKPIMSAIIPPFNAMESMGSIRPDKTLLKRLVEEKTINLVYAGNALSAGGARFALEIVENCIESYGPGICLYLLIDTRRIQADYLKRINSLVRMHKLGDAITMITRFDGPAVLSYYLGCDFFLGCDDGDSFNPGPVTAQYLHLPVIARKTRMASEMLGDDQLLLSGSAREYSAAVRVLFDDDAYKRFLAARGALNYEARYSHRSVERALTAALERFAGMKP